jgi:hypothetical protein
MGEGVIKFETLIHFIICFAVDEILINIKNNVSKYGPINRMTDI